MKRYCIYCNKAIKKNDVETSNICPHCNNEFIYNGDDEDKKHLINQKTHASLTKSKDMKDSALSFLVIGGIILIVSIVFILLSFKYNVLKIRVFTPASLEFVVACIGSAASLFCLIYGGIKLTKALLRINYFSRHLNLK